MQYHRHLWSWDTDYPPDELTLRAKPHDFRVFAWHLSPVHISLPVPIGRKVSARTVRGLDVRLASIHSLNWMFRSSKEAHQAV